MIHYGDITKISGYEVPIVDIVCGGSPCQDLSIAGLRKGLQGERSGLFMEQIRIVKEMREHDKQQKQRNGTDVDLRCLSPRYMVWENVPGALSSNNGRDFQAVLTEIIRICEPNADDVPLYGGCGRQAWTPSGAIFGISNGVPFSVAYRVHDAQFWGVPQRRKRIALVADFNGLSASEILFERKGLPRDPKQEREKRQEVATTFGRSPYEAISFQERAGCDGGGKGILIQNDRTGALSTVNNQYVLSDTVCIEGNGSRPSHHGDGYIESDKMYTLNTTEQHKVAYVVGGGQSRCSVNKNIITNLEERSDQEDVACAYAQDRYDTFSPSDISPTIKAQGGSYGGEVNHLLYQDKVNSLCASDMKGVGNQYVTDGKVIIERKK